MADEQDRIAVSLRRVIYTVLEREVALMGSCPKMPDSEYREAMAAVHVAQEAVDEALREFRTLTSSRFDTYIDSEIILSCFVLGSIWHNARDLGIRSHRLGDIIGRHKPEALAELALRLTEKTSPVLAFLRVKWSSWSEPAGQYCFSVRKPEVLLHLVFGKTCAASQATNNRKE